MYKIIADGASSLFPQANKLRVERVLFNFGIRLGKDSLEWSRFSVSSGETQEEGGDD